MPEPRRFQHSPPELTGAPSSWPQQSTAAGILLRGHSVLLELRPSSARIAPDTWDTPGGHLAPGERPEQALLRELEEELGIVPQAFRLAAVQDELAGEPEHPYRHFVFLVSRWSGEVCNREGQRLQWLPVMQALELDRLNPLVGLIIKDLLEAGWISA